LGNINLTISPLRQQTLEGWNHVLLVFIFLDPNTEFGLSRCSEWLILVDIKLPFTILLTNMEIRKVRHAWKGKKYDFMSPTNKCKVILGILKVNSFILKDT
jgi:hypothetical protein